MKLKALLCFITLSLAFLPAVTKADSAAAGSISYQWVSDSTYNIYLTHYRSCSAASAPDSFELCIYDSCSGQKFTRSIYKITGNIPGKGMANGHPVRLLCDSNDNRCNNVSGTFSGTREWWYSTQVTLPYRCGLWRFSVSIDHRTNSDNLVNGEEFYVEAFFHFNNVNNTFRNSSPVFYQDAVRPVCINNQVLFSNAAVDPDGDSLTYRVIMPKKGATCPDTPANVTFTNQSPGLSIPTNPLRSGNSFAINYFNGLSSFTPIAGGSSESVVTYLIEEYRDKQLIGSSMREVRFLYNTACNSQQPTFTHDAATLAGASFNASANIMSGCINNSMQLCMDIKSASGSARLRVQDNSGVIMQGANIGYGNQGTDSVRVCFVWTPSLTDTGEHHIIFSVVDSNCGAATGLLQKNTFVLTVYIPPPAHAATSVPAICQNETAQLVSRGGWGNYTWQVLSGTTGSLSCTGCAQPQATPQVTTEYRVSTTNALCPNNPFYSDTVTVNVYTSAPSTPTISISATPGTTVPVATTVDFTANVTACNNPEYQWIKNGGIEAGETAATWMGMMPADGDRVECRLNCRDTCAKPKIILSNRLVMEVNSSITAPAKNSQQLSIYPNPNKGSFTLNTSVNISPDAMVQVLNTYGQLVHKQNLESNTQQINTGRLPAGIYLLRVQNGAQTQSARFVVE